MGKFVPDPEPWKQPGLGLRGSLNIIEASRKILLGESLDSLPSMESLRYPQPHQVTINTRCKPSQRPKATIDITQVGRLEHNPLGWTTQAGDTHNRSQYDTREFKQTCKAVAGAGAGLKEASMETRRHAAFNHWNTELSHIVDVDRNTLPTTSNMMAHHGRVKPQAAIDTAQKTNIQISNGKWYGKATTAQAHYGPKLHGAGFEASNMHDLRALHDHGKLTQRQCDGPDDPMLTHAQMQFYAKKSTKRLPPPPRNISQPEMQTVFGVTDVAAGYIPPNRTNMKTQPKKDFPSSNPHPDTANMLTGKWQDNQWSTPYDTEAKSQFYEKPRNFKPQNVELKMTQSTVAMTSPGAPWPYHTTNATYQEEAATHLMTAPSRALRRFATGDGPGGAGYPSMQERTGAVGESMVQGGDTFGPIVVGQRGSAVGRSDHPQAMTGMEYNETSVVHHRGVNASEYNKNGAAWKVTQPESCTRADRHARITQSQVSMAAVFSEDPRYTYAGGERGGWYQTANRDAFVRHPNEKRAHARHFAGAGTASTVQLGSGLLLEQDQFNRSVSVSHQQFPGYAGGQYRDPVLEAKYVTAERARNASDICLWRSESTGVRYQHQAVEAERGVRKGGARGNK